MNILFSHNDDYTTKVILEWLNYFGKDFIRINNESIDIDEISLSDKRIKTTFDIDGKIINENKIKSTWYRGGKIRIKNNIYDPEIVGKESTTKYEAIISYLSNYSLSKKEFLVNELKNGIGKNATGRFNKIIALKNAKLVGLNIPNTLITKSKSSLQKFKNSNRRIITKSLDLGFSTPNSKNLDGDEIRFTEYTSEVTQEDINQFNEVFAISLFQNMINKEFEIRTFFINNRCFSAAIFSQQNSKTTVDYRRYDYDNMNRILPFNLPESIEEKLIEFMKLSNLNTGSIDFIKTKKNKYVFLEVNANTG